MGPCTQIFQRPHLAKVWLPSLWKVCCRGVQETEVQCTLVQETPR